MKKFEQERTILGRQNERIDEVIKSLFKSKISDSEKFKLLDIARKVKTIIANTTRIIDG